MKPPGLCVAGAITLHQVPCEENTACVQRDLIIPAYGVLSGKLFHKTCLCGSLIGISDRNQGQEHYIAVLALTFCDILEASLPLP